MITKNQKQTLTKPKGILGKIRSKKSQKGITLIALVISIIVLLILAGVSISTLTGENGLLTKANQAKVEIEKAGERDLIQLAYTAAMMDDYKNTDTSKTFKDFLEEELAKNGLTDTTVFDNSNESYIVQLANAHRYNIKSDGTVEQLQKVADVKGGEKLSRTSNIIIEDNEGNLIVVPAGFKVASDSATSVKGGIVIEDEDVTEDGNGDLRGNQFVWIPVTKDVKGNNTKPYSATGALAKTGEVIKLSRYEFADGTSTYTANDGTSLGKLDPGTPIDRGTAAIVDSYNSSYTHTEDTTSYTNTKAINLSGTGGFKESVATNGGYYIARYEASYGKNGRVNSKVSKGTPLTSGTVTTEGMLWNFIKQGDAATASKSMYTSGKFTSDLVNSYAWDTAIVFIQTCGGSSYSTYSRQPSLNKSLANTGANDDNPLNINDMASNIVEWTTETSNYPDNPCTGSGGFYDRSYTYTSTRGFDSTSGSNYSITFRPLLYLQN